MPPGIAAMGNRRGFLQCVGFDQRISPIYPEIVHDVASSDYYFWNKTSPRYRNVKSGEASQSAFGHDRPLARIDCTTSFAVSPNTQMVRVRPDIFQAPWI